MKKTISLFLVLFLINLSIKAQGNLQYNKVVLVTLSGTYQGTSVDTVFTVPVGKVWKIESGMIGSTSSPTYNYGLYISGKLICFTGYSSSSGHFPIWLPSGIYTLSGICANSGGVDIKGAISAIEYNEVP